VVGLASDLLGGYVTIVSSAVVYVAIVHGGALEELLWEAEPAGERVVGLEMNRSVGFLFFHIKYVFLQIILIFH
jgi:hypothetical protein